MDESKLVCLRLSRPAGGVLQITLDRPDLMNRVDEDFHREMIEVLGEVAGDRSVRAIVLAATGKVFSAGGDFDFMRQAHADVDVRQRTVDDGRRLADAFMIIPQPIVAAVHGAAIGVGATLVLLCDAVVAARAAKIADTHVAVGLVAGDGGCVAWPHSAGMLRARRYLLTGDALDAATAHTFGLVTDLVDTPEETLAVALDIAGRMAARAPLAVQGTKRALNRLTAQRAGEVLDLSFALEQQTLASEDLLEGINAFQERRPPEFRGR
ncbi:enoyl-CoA hydratase/isomerase family protein [Streptomyces chlorus]|uniref:Enoyl-CoA hydratase/isomerase family protein n=1 Tax=Streptomyces chlorus TaxID=887452 RepID=A0ABW1DZB7_9ACTN